MTTLRPGVIAMAVAAGALTLSGCATKGFVREQVTIVDAKAQSTQTQVTGHETQLQTQGQKLAELDATSRQALERAQAAGKLAEGKFEYSVVLSDDSIMFPANRANLTPEAQSRLLELAQKLKGDNRNVYLEIQGYTDRREARRNRELGKDRAEAVRRFLNQQGVALNRMATIAFGDETAVAANTAPAPAPAATAPTSNRRVVVVVLA